MKCLYEPINGDYPTNIFCANYQSCHNCGYAYFENKPAYELEPAIVIDVDCINCPVKDCDNCEKKG